MISTDALPKFEDPGYVVPPISKTDVGTRRAISAFFFVVLADGIFLLLTVLAIGGGVGLVWTAGGPLSAAVGVLLALFGAAGAAIVVAGMHHALRTTGVSFRREAANAWRRLRRRPGGRQSFASQRFTGTARRKQ